MIVVVLFLNALYEILRGCAAGLGEHLFKKKAAKIICCVVFSFIFT